MSTALAKKYITENWKSGVTVALISVPLSIALSIASGAGPLPGIITGMWATLIASIFCSSNYNIIGPAGALSTVLFAATLVPAFGIGILPLIAIGVGIALFVVFALRADRFLYYVPASIIHGFSAGVAILIAASQLFDAAGLTVKRTGQFIGDLVLFAQHFAEHNANALITFVIFVVGILTWKKYIKSIPAVIPAALIGMLVGFITTKSGIHLTTLADKFGTIQASFFLPVDWSLITSIIADHEALTAYIKVVLLVAAIAILETLITAKIGDKMTHTQSVPRRELFGLALANLGSGIMGGLPATGVFLRTGANIKAGATHRTSAGIAALTTAVIAFIAMPFFVYLPAAVIAAMLINTALGLIEIPKFKEYWRNDKQSFGIAVLVATITVLEDPGMAVLIGVVVALLMYIDRVSRGHSNLVYNFVDGTMQSSVLKNKIALPTKPVRVAVYSLAGAASYISVPQHYENLLALVRSQHVHALAVRLRDCYTVDLDAAEMIEEIAHEAHVVGKAFVLSSVQHEVLSELTKFPELAALAKNGKVYDKAGDMLAAML